MNFDLKTAKLNLAWLYPEYLNLYGDQGNVMALRRRAEWRGITFNVSPISIGDEFIETDYDLVFIGGGQDQEQASMHLDLIEKKAEPLRKFIEQGGVLLAICGGYQLLGQYYKTNEGKLTKGIGVLPVYTQAQNKRLIGNVEFVAEKLPLAEKDRHMFGFENHSGLTYFLDESENRESANNEPEGTASHEANEVDAKAKADQAALSCQALYAFGKVVKGNGNNGEDGYEGCHYKNTFGTYAHGSFLPKNPAFADYLLALALQRKYNLASDYRLPALSEPLLGNLRQDLAACEV